MSNKKSKYQVLSVLVSLYQKENKGVTTSDVAEEANLSRGVISHYLSQLLEEKLVEKYGTKPVYWSPRPKKETAFNNFIGSDGSLKKVIENCKSAVHYPPNGFPIIITGPSGVGKTLLAKLIFDYSKDENVISSESQFVSINCADYANNPELLSSVLFGYKKGAFTDAKEDTLGLVSKANNGYLFLDEIHRLNEENQEKLFTLLDSGEYYPLGETEIASNAKIRFIFATTESLDKNLLQTFQRRVPMRIELPAYVERPIDERYQLISYMFFVEALQMKKKLFINPDYFHRLAGKNDSGNIGSLRNDIKLLCAQTYKDQKNKDILIIGTPLTDKTKYIKIEWENGPENFTTPDSELKSVGEKIHCDISQIHQFSSTVETKFIIQKNLRSLKELFFDGEKIDPIIHMIMDQIKKFQCEILNRRYGLEPVVKFESIYEAAILIHVFYKIKNIEVENNFIRGFKIKYPRAFFLINQLIEKISYPSNIEPLNRDVLVTLLTQLFFEDSLEKIESVNFTSILLSHGRSTASSIQEVVNNLCGNYLFESFDMPIDTSMREISHLVNEYLKDMKNVKSGVILLFDMGSLSQMYKEIKKNLDMDLLVINNLTTSMALDIGLQIQQDKTFKTIAERAEEYGDLTRVQYYEGLSQNKNIIVSCMSGVGLSEEIKRIMEKTLDEKTEIITMDYKLLKQTLNTHDYSYFLNTKFIITTTDLPKIDYLPIINIYSIMEEPGASVLHKILLENNESRSSIERLMEDLLQFFTIEGISERLQFLNPKVVIKEVQDIIRKYNEYYSLNLEGKAKLSLYMHIALMIERMLITSRKNEQKNNETFYPLEEVGMEEFFSISKNIFHSVENKYNIIIDNYELSLMYELIKSTM